MAAIFSKGALTKISQKYKKSRFLLKMYFYRNSKLKFRISILELTSADFSSIGLMFRPDQKMVEFFPGTSYIFVYGGVRMEGKIQTQTHGFPENFAPKNIGTLHISYPKIWVKIVF